ncbi:MAG: hypothetical protein WCK37_02670 [Candidatus Falkowbacteria bacterium]
MPENIFSKKEKVEDKIILREGVKQPAKPAFSIAPFFNKIKKYGEALKFKKVSDNPFSESDFQAKTKDVKKVVPEIKPVAPIEVRKPIFEIKPANNNKEAKEIKKEITPEKPVAKKEKDKPAPVKVVEPKSVIISNPKILEMDLISDQIEISFDWKKNLSIMGTFVLISLVLVGEIYLTLFLWQANEINAKTEKLQVESQSINKEVENNKAKAAEALDFKNRAELTAPILAKHVYWTNFFSYLEKNTLADVFYSGFNGGVDGTYALKAFVKDYRAIGVQLKTFLAGEKTATASITNERINNSGNNVGVVFDLSLSIRNDLFNK